MLGRLGMIMSDYIWGDQVIKYDSTKTYVAIA